MSAPRSNTSLSVSDSDNEGVHEDEQTDVPSLADIYDVYTGYLPSLRAHIRDTIAHLAGYIPSHDGACVGPPTKSTSAPPEAPQDGVLPPDEQIEGSPDLPRRDTELTIWRSSLSSWSKSEVDAFFHALSVYSRWRPDLIADAVKTKGEIEVAEFLITLDSCARSHAIENNQDIAPTPLAAMEVSDEWVAAEEAMAATIAVQDDGELQDLEALRGKRVRDARTDMIPRGKRRRVITGVDEDELMGDEAEREDGNGDEDDIEAINAGKARFEKWHAHKIAAWKREDLLMKLENAHLQVLDTILREDEDAQKRKGLTRESADASDPDTGMDLKALSPTSRRRLTKRLYMRRKRAQLRGEDVGQAGEVTVDLERMKPGRKADRKGKGKATSVVGREELPSEKTDSGRATITPESDGPGPLPSVDGLEDADGTTAKRNTKVSGKTRHQKIRAELENAGIDASYLHKHDMGLFHHGPLGKLMGIFKPLAQYPDDDISTSCVSADLLRYLQVLVVAFTTDVIHRATIWKEQANELKGQKKVWRGGLHQINQAAVEHALKTMGVRTMNKQEHFSKLLDHYDLSSNKQIHEQKSSSPVAADAKGEQSITAEHSPDAQSKQHEIGLSPHRALYTPAFLAPAAFNIHAVDTFFPGYDACFPSNSRINKDSYEETEDTLLPDETDEGALEDELRWDEMVNQTDVESGKRFEEQLWADHEVEREDGERAGVASE